MTSAWRRTRDHLVDPVKTSPPPVEVLLVAQPPIRSDQEIDSGLFGSLEQRTVGKPIPTLLICSHDRVTR